LLFSHCAPPPNSGFVLCFNNQNDFGNKLIELTKLFTVFKLWLKTGNGPKTLVQWKSLDVMIDVTGVNPLE
jgi:hypothetical protein